MAAKDGDMQWSTWLSALGFISEMKGSFSLWHLPLNSLDENDKSEKVLKSNLRQRGFRSPWSLEELVLVERKAALSINSAKLTLHKDILLANLAKLARKHFGARATCEFTEGNKGEIWCLFEFSRPGSREKSAGKSATAAGSLLPYGMGGFNFRLQSDGLHGRLIIADYFGFGYLPPTLVSAPLRYLAQALGFELGMNEVNDFTCRSVYELTFSLINPIITSVRRISNTTVDMNLLRQELVVSKATSVFLGSEKDRKHVFTYPGSENQGLEGLTGSYVPLEVLESREREAFYQDVDQSIAAGKLNGAWQKALEQHGKNQKSLYLVRRLALLALVGMTDAEAAAAIDKALLLETNSKLFLSESIHRAMAEGRNATALANLSHLGSILAQSIVGMESLRCFELVLPELLGDVWCSENPEKAEECYLRVLERRGDMPRLLRKLIHLARGAGNDAVEIGYLKRLADVERRHKELARIYYRLAELKRKDVNLQEEVIAMVLKSLSFDRSHYRSALLAADLLLEKGKPEEALQMLDSLLKDTNISLSSQAKGRIETVIGRIWHYQMHRSDLAETRYEAALRFDPNNLEALVELERLYRRDLRPEALASILEAQFEIFEQQREFEKLRDVFEEIVALYRGILGQPNRAFELYRRLIISTRIEAEELERVLGWSDVDIDWHDLYQQLLQRLPDYERGLARAKYLYRLGEICREKLKEKSKALRHIRDALEDGWVDAAGFLFLTEGLAAQRDYADLARCYELRIGQVTAKEKRHLIIELLNVPEVLSDVKRDQLAIQAYVLGSELDSVLLQRLSFYQSVDDVEGVARIVDLVLNESTLTNAVKERWLRHAIQVLEGCSDEQRFVLIDQSFRKLLALGSDDLNVLHDAIDILKVSANAQILRFYLSESLRRGILPQLPEKHAINILKGLHRELAIYHQLMSLKTVENESAAQHARMAATFFKKCKGEEHNTFKMLGRLCTLMPCSNEDLKQLEDLAKETGDFGLLVRALQKQADFEDESERKLLLLEKYAEIQWHFLKDYEAAYQGYTSILRFSTQPLRLQLILAEIAHDSNDVKRELKAYRNFLQNEGCLLDLKSLRHAVERMRLLGQDEQTLTQLIQPYIEQNLLVNNYEMAGHLCLILIENNIRSVEFYKIAFRAALVAKDPTKAAELWRHGLSLVSSRTHVRSYIAETRTLLDREGFFDLMIDCLKGALDSWGNENQDAKIYREILIHYGAMLFESNTKRRKALAIYEKAYTEDRNDIRTWMPLYFLFLEFGTLAQRLSHLQEILPKLKMDPRPLKSFPITLESLQVELKELISQSRNAEPNETLLDTDLDASIDYSDSRVVELRKPSRIKVDQSGDRNLPGEDYSVSFTKSDDHVARSNASFGGAALSLAIENQTSESTDVLPLSINLAPLEDEAEFDHNLLEGEPTAVDSPISHDFEAWQNFEEPAQPLPLEEALPLENLDIPSNIIQESELTLPLDDVSLQVDFPEPPAAFNLGEIKFQSDELGSFSAAAPEDNLSVEPDGELIADSQLSESPDSEQAAVTLSLDEDPLKVDLQNQDTDSSSVELDMALDTADEVGILSLSEEAMVLDKSLDHSGAQPDPILPPLPQVTIDYDVMDEDESEDSVKLEIPNTNLVELPPLPESAASLPTDDTDDEAAESEEESNEGSEAHLESELRTAGTESRHSAESAVFGGGKLYSASFEPQPAALDWRAAVLNSNVSPDLVGGIVTQAFENELEKHIAIQTVALVAGMCDSLGNWHWQVWRKSGDYGYALTAKDRFPASSPASLRSSSMHKYLLTIAPLLVHLYKSRFTTKYLCRKLGIEPKVIERHRKPLSWENGLLYDVGFRLYGDRIAARGFKAYNFPGLEAEIFYEGHSKTIYLDAKYYSGQPPSYLFHRLLGLIWSVRINYFVPLALNPTSEIMPVFLEMHQAFNSNGLSRLKNRLKSRSPLETLLGRLDTQKYRDLSEKVGIPAEEIVVQLCKEMHEHIQRLLLAETLDIIGVFEAMLGRDLTQPNAIKSGEIYSLSPFAKNLIEFITRLSI